MVQVRGGILSESTWVQFQPKSCLHLLHNQSFVIKLHIKRTYEIYPVRQHYHYCHPLSSPMSSSPSNYPAVSEPASSVNPLQMWIHLPLLRGTEAEDVKIYHDWLHCSQEISDIMFMFRKQSCLFFPPNCLGIVTSYEKSITRED